MYTLKGVQSCIALLTTTPKILDILKYDFYWVRIFSGSADFGVVWVCFFENESSVHDIQAVELRCFCRRSRCAGYLLSFC